MKLDIIETVKTTSDSISIRFKKPPGLKYKAGQHGQFRFLFDGQKVLRTYSFNSAPGIDTEIAITVKALEGGIISQRLLKGKLDSIELEAVSGSFFVEPSHELERHLSCLREGAGLLLSSQ